MNSIRKTFCILCLSLLTSSFVVAQNDSIKESVDNQKTETLLTKAGKNLFTDPNKAFSYLNEILNYKNTLTKEQLLQLYKLTATAYYNQQSYLSSLEYFYKSLALQKSWIPQKYITSTTILVVHIWN